MQPGAKPMTMHANLEAAYRNTDYWVDDAPDEPFAIRIGEPSLELAVILTAAGEFEWAFVTACNPGSVQFAERDNQQRMWKLEEAVRSGGWFVYHGHGVGRDSEWPPEPSLLILGISETEALDLAQTFGQNAIVAGRLGEPARLVWAAGSSENHP
jgi:hypothetical protein